MKRTAGVLASVLVLSASGLVAAPSQAATIMINVVNYEFEGGPRVVAQGTVVHWMFLAGPHTTTSTQGFWASPVNDNGDSYERTFNEAGAFEYYCDIHGHHSMNSTISVRLKTSAVAGGKRIRWASAAFANHDYDVQMKRVGAAKWRTFRSATKALTGDFKPTTTGRWVFRARTRNLDNSAVSGWSPNKRVRIG